MEEMMKLQGIQPNRLQVPPSVPLRQVKMMLGNAMSLNVMRKLLDRAMNAVGLRNSTDPRVGEGLAGNPWP